MEDERKEIRSDVTTITEDQEMTDEKNKISG